MSPNARVLFGLFAGLAAGSVVGDGPVERFAAAVGTLWVNAIRMTALPLIVALLIGGVAAVGDARTLGRLGTRALALFASTLAVAGAGSGLLTPFALRALPVDTAAAPWRSATPPPRPPHFMTHFLQQVVPANPFQAAAEGSILAVVVFTLAFAIALLFIPAERRAAVVQLSQAVAAAMLVLLGWVLWAAPLGIAALAFSLAAKAGWQVAGALAFYVTLLITLILLGLFALYPLLMTFGRRRLPELVRAFWPAQALAASSRSSLAAFPLMVEAAHGSLRLPPAVSGFALPLAVSLFRPSASISLVVAALFVARVNGLSWSVPETTTLVALAVLLSFSVPGVPNASFVMMVPLFETMGLPVEAVGILLAVDSIPDIFKTTLNVTAQLGAAVLLSQSGAWENREGRP
jgi:Na+/H+-dicarboxylate symporter